VFETFLNAFCSPLIHLYLFCLKCATSLSGIKLVFLFLCVSDQPLDVLSIIGLIPDDLLEYLTKLNVDFIIYWKFACVDDSHVHTVLDRMVQENRMESLS